MKSKLKLTDREWREFVFGKLFDISSTSSSIDKKRLTGILGNNPYITRSENNNGIDSFIDKQACFLMDEANVITIGLDTQTVFYQSYPFYTGQNIQVVRHPQLNKHNALFVIRIIRILVQKFNWGSYGATLTRLRRGKLFLPVDTNHLPDWAFMEAYMKQVEEELLADSLPKLEQQLLNNIITLGALDDREWREFRLGDKEFFSVSGTKTTHPSDLVDGGYTPRITCAATNNGLDGCYRNEPTEKGGILTIDSATVGYVSYQSIDFIATDHVEKLEVKSHHMDRYTGLFLKMCIDKATSGKYGYGYKFAQTRIKRQTILLPIQAGGTPDWEFMSAFMKRVEQETLSEALRHLRPKKM